MDIKHLISISMAKLYTLTIYQYNSSIYHLYFLKELGPAFRCSLGRSTIYQLPLRTPMIYSRMY